MVMDWNIWKGKKVFIRTSFEKVYSGIIKEVWEERPNVWMIQLIDKFDKNVVLLSNQIYELKEEN